MIKWLISLSENERQTLTTWSMWLGTVALTVAVGLLVWMQRYSWPASVITQYAGALIDGFFWVIYGLIGLMAVQIIAQAVIAIGGKMKASFGGASIEAETNDDAP